MISCLMQKTCSPTLIDQSSNYIKLYLSFLSEWTKYLTPNQKKPVYLTNYSMLNLLNLPNTMRRFGPLRNFWEGSTMGEGMLKKVKANYRRMHPNWEMCLTSKTMQMRSFIRIFEKLQNENELSSDKEQSKVVFSDRANHIYVFKNHDQLMDHFERGLPISVVITHNHNIFAVVTNDLLYNINPKKFGMECFGLNYFEFERPVLSTTMLLEHLDVKDFGIMLPKLTGQDDLEEMITYGVFTIVTMEWTKMNNDGKFSTNEYSHLS